MFSSIEILTKNERQNSRLGTQRKKFKLTGNSILNGEQPITHDFSKRRTHESDKGDHQGFLMKLGYSVSDDPNYQEYQKKNRGSSNSTDLQSGNRLTSRQSNSNSVATRVQSIELNNNYENLNCPRTSVYNPRTIRKTFQSDNSDGGLENFSDHSHHISLDKTPKPNTSASFPKEKSSIIPTLIQYKFQRIRRCFQMIKALLRMKSLSNQKKTSWSLKQEILRRNQKSLKFNESLTMIKIKQWTQMVFSKMISFIQQKRLDKCKLNFIDNPESMTQLEKDQAIIVVSNIFTFAMSNLVIMTSCTNLINELQVMMYQEQFYDYRKQFSKFVSQRANYISSDYQVLTEQEKQIILSECVIINNLIPSLVKLTESLDVLKCNKPSIEFLIRSLISLIQYFFIQNFSNFPKIAMKKQKINFFQYQLGKIDTSMIIVQNTQLKSDDMIFGTYNEQQLKDFISKENWSESNKSKMNQVANNLIRIF
ncbi:unnamed protein product (macronuclear) [Paramecium tetraurelia]|uniref:Uncharacterized protein n=1 Tax=Paramecium tetraurelia TaxID=5888 RepID=A0E5B8_PARTE|nr:uncharacterized protein GSPATT00023662001 [Paramecium tetraurelia]CAK90485.1 unnamed protein product [Paramecium tetraurelia]|eukprot:XP_001457882.1 hypothetical protein (macronuclear) [Paramecium tetraurelia strain d4-2]